MLVLPPGARQRPRLGHASPAWQQHRALWEAAVSTAGSVASRLLWRCPRGRLAAEGDVVKKPKVRLDAWAEAQRRFHLSDLPIQMARELGLNPKQCGGLANHRQES